ncbi:MAG TPA: MBL fold metallo-hydrolase [Candidatus Krumholzibacteria bacterium]|nr:MBL fold metallo-hydrolase [Candidatus Krumholzibacteria bacterium]HPD70277.1 MBL fold metallo-hydrolase [Candidatus Krumholzibacteria bacterium]HRY40023.1 MBL fold metallo-hydrolase [Candidatus Krumholzibacteria bacterium]
MMTTLVVPCALSLLLLGAADASGETIEGLPVHVHRFDSGAIRVWVGDHISSTATVAIPTSAGVIVVDTTGEPKTDPKLRRVIARELGRDDFVMLINTHEHGDHTGGNGVYADCEIVGHELVAAAMARQAEDVPRRLEWSRRAVGELETQIAGLAADAPELPRLREELVIQRMHAEWLADAPVVAPPTRTFNDRLDLEVGDTRLELFYIGGMHTSSDIAILVPKHELLLTGDTMADVWLTDTPGCLGAFAAHPGVRHDFPLLLENWNLLLARKADVETLLPGHWNGELTWAGFEARVRYIEALWEGVQRMAAAGATVDQVQQEYALPTRFPELVGSPGCDPNLNRGTIREMWSVVTGQQYASDALNAAMRDEAAFRDVIARVRAKSPTYYYDEPSLNMMGYWLIEIREFPKAVEVFRLNADLFPESWNAHDSLAEGLLRAGDRAGAIASYERSLELNPENGNGRQMLEQIRDGVENPTPPRPGQS